jgi:SAM-dependent methyltransferase
MSEQCPLCGGTASPTYTGYPGYRAPDVYSLYRCDACRAAFSQPRTVPPGIYDQIYAQIERIPGYDRYAAYARKVRTVRDPLAYLARSEDAYWGIACVVQRYGAAALGRTVEVGSGLGYLTYALHRAGVNIRGLDLSQAAVDRAAAAFGPIFACGDLRDVAAHEPGSVDTVIACELLEHIDDVVGFMRSAVDLVAAGGRLVLTTPNRTFFPPETIWETDAPPLHLWWFTEESMRRLAARFGLNVEFVDFTGYNTTDPIRPYPPDYRGPTTNHSPMLDADGKPSYEKCRTRATLLQLGLLPLARRTERLVRRITSRERAGARRWTMCLLFTKAA